MGDPGIACPDQSMSTVIYLSARNFTGIPGFLRANKGWLSGFAAVYVFALLAVLRLRRYVTDGKSLDVSEDASRVFMRPYSVALLITLLSTIGFATSAPTGVSFVVFGLIYLSRFCGFHPVLSNPERGSFCTRYVRFTFLNGCT